MRDFVKKMSENSAKVMMLQLHELKEQLARKQKVLKRIEEVDAKNVLNRHRTKTFGVNVVYETLAIHENVTDTVISLSNGKDILPANKEQHPLIIDNSQKGKSAPHNLRENGEKTTAYSGNSILCELKESLACEEVVFKTKLPLDCFRWTEISTPKYKSPNKSAPTTPMLKYKNERGLTNTSGELCHRRSCRLSSKKFIIEPRKSSRSEEKQALSRAMVANIFEILIQEAKKLCVVDFVLPKSEYPAPKDKDNGPSPKRTRNDLDDQRTNFEAVEMADTTSRCKAECQFNQSSENTHNFHGELGANVPLSKRTLSSNENQNCALEMDATNDVLCFVGADSSSVDRHFGKEKLPEEIANGRFLVDTTEDKLFQLDKEQKDSLQLCNSNSSSVLHLFDGTECVKKVSDVAKEEPDFASSFPQWSQWIKLSGDNSPRDLDVDESLQKVKVSVEKIADDGLNDTFSVAGEELEIGVAVIHTPTQEMVLVRGGKPPEKAHETSNQQEVLNAFSNDDLDSTFSLDATKENSNALNSTEQLSQAIKLSGDKLADDDFCFQTLETFSQISHEDEKEEEQLCYLFTACMKLLGEEPIENLDVVVDGEVVVAYQKSKVTMWSQKNSSWQKIKEYLLPQVSK